MVPLVRSMISVPAGVERMGLPLFLALTAAGSLIWNSAFVMAGYLLGENWHIVEGYAGIASRVVLVAVVIAALVFVGRRIARKRRGTPLVDAPTERIPVVAPRASAQAPAPQWSAQPSSTEWSVQPTEQIPVIHPDESRPPVQRRPGQ
jgi:hypothetical protein